jgi:hypothetical protein
MEIITKEFCKDNILIFYPKTTPESTFIQERLLEMGFQWHKGNKEVLYLQESIKTALVIRNGNMLHGMPSSDDKANGIVCTSAQFDTLFDKGNPDNMSDRELMTALFNKVSALAEEVAIIKNEVMPKHLSKDRLERK